MEFQVSGGGCWGWASWAPLAIFGGGWEAITLSDISHKCLASAWLRRSVTVVGSGRCWWGSSSGSSAVIVRGAWKREKRARRLEGDVPAVPYLRPMFKGRKGTGALHKELLEPRLLWQGQASWRKWVSLGLGDKKIWTRGDWRV